MTMGLRPNICSIQKLYHKIYIPYIFYLIFTLPKSRHKLIQINTFHYNYSLGGSPLGGFNPYLKLLCN